MARIASIVEINDNIMSIDKVYHMHRQHAMYIYRPN